MMHCPWKAEPTFASSNHCCHQQWDVKSPVFLRLHLNPPGERIASIPIDLCLPTVYPFDQPDHRLALVVVDSPHSADFEAIPDSPFAATESVQVEHEIVISPVLVSLPSFALVAEACNSPHAPPISTGPGAIAPHSSCYGYSCCSLLQNYWPPVPISTAQSSHYHRCCCPLRPHYNTACMLMMTIAAGFHSGNIPRYCPVLLFDYCHTGHAPPQSPQEARFLVAGPPVSVVDWTDSSAPQTRPRYSETCLGVAKDGAPPSLGVHRSVPEPCNLTQRGRWIAVAIRAGLQPPSYSLRYRYSCASRCW
mmetsp:Transcript_31481/g.76126  ORF Transcript_31481/g.76126 Transcript_31481/m.76126 type:complete len:306 (-) Transcript_31481:393-1310(-)